MVTEEFESIETNVLTSEDDKKVIPIYMRNFLFLCFWFVIFIGALVKFQRQ